MSLQTNAATKLTKKQKKGLAFRERKTRKGKYSNGLGDNDIPVLEDQNVLYNEIDHVETEAVIFKKQPETAADTLGLEGKHKNKRKAASEPGEVQRKKRKRATDDGDRAEQKKKEGGVEEMGEKKLSEAKQRFILFIGNLKYSTSLEAIKAHFSKCDPPPTIRLLTPKPSSAKIVTKSKGCAFLEFSHRNALQQALKLHQSTLEGRVINVELTAGGGGNSESRLAKLKARNKQMLGQRKERVEQTADGNTTSIMPDRPQRYSATSGIDQIPVKQRTWTVGDVEDGSTHRGGKRHAKGSKGRVKGKSFGTGVNAIPVG